MPDKLKRAQGYRTRAAKLRAIARDLVQQSERELLMQLADEYDLMAQSAGSVAEVTHSVGSDGAARPDREMKSGMQRQRRLR